MLHEKLSIGLEPLLSRFAVELINPKAYVAQTLSETEGRHRDRKIVLAYAN